MYGNNLVPLMPISTDDQSTTPTSRRFLVRIVEFETQKRRRATGKRYMWKNIFVFLALVSYPTLAQVVSGSILIFNVTKDELIVAADSLAENHDTGIPDYSNCKISAFGHQLIFTSVGNTGMSRAGVILWQSTDLAKDAVHSARKTKDGTIDASDAIFHWAQNVKGRWDLEDRAVARKAAMINNWQLTSGAFVGKGFDTELAVVSFDDAKLIDPIEYHFGHISDINTCWRCGQLGKNQICGAGRHLDVAAKFCSERKHRDRIKIRTHLRGASESTKLAIKIVEMTIDQYGETAKDVGGVVDSITTTKTGRLTWNARKENCPENQD
ncbi:MAG TPA: hypothetical protein VE957_07240 [Terriglobales bacterium]|nr:hypothetical protein [Terriglobales bacterium]